MNLRVFLVALILHGTGATAAAQRPSEPLSGINQNQKASKETNKGEGEKKAPSPPTGPAQVSVEGGVNVVNEDIAKYVQAYAADQLRPWWKNADWWTVILGALASFFAWLAFRSSQSQLKLAKEQFIQASSPHLHVERAWAEGIGPNQSPVVFIEIKNSGPVIADGVAVKIKLALTTGSAEYSGGDQTLTVPANGSRIHFLKSNLILTPQGFADINVDPSSVRIEGYVRYKDKEIKYCYKYNPSDIASLPQFIPCDFDTRRSVSATVYAKGQSVALTMGTVQPQTNPPNNKP